MHNSDKRPGKVALVTDLLWDLWRNPSAMVPEKSLIKLAYSMLETTRIPKKWVKILNADFDAVVVPDEYVLNLYQDSGVHIPVFVLSLPMLLAPYNKRPIHEANPSKPFIFGDASANKNPAVLIEAFARAFGNDPDVHLFMRAGQINPEARDLMNRTIGSFGLANVTIEDGHISLE